MHLVSACFAVQDYSMNHHTPTFTRLRRLLPLLPTLLIAPPALAEDPTPLPPVEVEAETQERYAVSADDAQAGTADIGALLEQVPGAAVNRNGALTGIAQYRGLYGDRVNVVVDGAALNASCTNAMDPPLSHIPTGQLESLTVIRGIAPVSAGLETLGGSIAARSKRGWFGETDSLESHGEVYGGGATVDNALSGGALSWLSNQQHKLYAAISRETADDAEYAGGRITPTRYARTHYATGYGLRAGAHEIGLDLSRTETGASGTPSLPMDIRWSDSDLASFDWRASFGRQQWQGHLSYSHIEHEMDNYTLRTPPNDSTRLAATETTGVDYRLASSFYVGGGALTLGVDGQLADHDATVRDPVNNPNFYVDNFNDVQRDRYGVYAEWTGLVAPDWSLEAGLRYTRVDMDAGVVSHFMYGMNAGITTLQDRFNNADRSIADNNIDAVLQLSYALTPETALIGGIARKTRSPSYQERYLWLPLEATAGLADGNLYVGDLALDPEVSHQIELGLDWRDHGAYLSPRLFYRDVSDYIQGTPATDATVVMVASNNGDSTPLQFSNVDATLYGIDTSAGIAFGEHWSLDAILSYVRGKRDDTDDALYRVAPLSATLALSYTQPVWSVTARSRMVARQSKVSTTNSETETAGFAVFDLSGRLTPWQRLQIDLGVANLFDTEYREHTAGINRVLGVDVAVGERVPAYGRSLYGKLTLRW